MTIINWLPPGIFQSGRVPQIALNTLWVSKVDNHDYKKKSITELLIYIIESNAQLVYGTAFLDF